MKTKSLRYVMDLGAYSVREDGVILDHEGRELHVYYDGTVRVRPDRGEPFRIGAHKLVAIAWVPNPHNYNVVKFKDGNKKNMHPDNLYWASSKHGGKKLNPGPRELATRIEELYKQGMGAKQIMEQLGTSKPYTYRVLQRMKYESGLDQ